MSRRTTRTTVVRFDGASRTERSDTLAAEEPLEIRVNGRSLAITMRTPGNDFELAAGFLASEGIISAADDVSQIRYCAGATDEGVNTYNVVDVILAPDVQAPDPSLERAFLTTSSCGLCGKASLDAVHLKAQWDVAGDPLALSAEDLTELPDRLRSTQQVFDSTGGLHAAGLFDAAGNVVCVREDVGRHNAVDKVIGHALQTGLVPLRGHILMVSGRASFELVQKAVMAGIPMLAAVSAPSSLAVDLARESGLTLVGFLRGSTMNVYAGAHRLS